MNEGTSELSTVVWTAFGVRAVLLLLVVILLLRRTLKIRRAIEARKFAGRYSASILLRGIFSPRKGWETPFTQEDIHVLRDTRSHLLLVLLLTLLVIFVNQQAREYVETEFELRGVPALSD